MPAIKTTGMYLFRTLKADRFHILIVPKVLSSLASPSFLRALSRNPGFHSNRSPIRLVPMLDWVDFGNDVNVIKLGYVTVKC